MIAELIGWIATALRASGMLMKSANMVKYLVSAGNFFWMLNGILTNNVPLIASNAICLVIMMVEIIKERRKNVRN
jgi:hypothetical protein